MKILKKNKKLRIFIISSFIAIFSLALISFDDDDDFILVKNLDIYHSLFRELRLFYVDGIDVAKLIETSISEMLKTLDPYTVYYPESKIDDYRFATTGEYGGIGALVQRKNDTIVVARVYENYPAHLAGILPGDIILEIQDKPLKGKAIANVGKFLKGLPNTKIKLLIKRPGQKKYLTKYANRKKILVKNVPYYGVIDKNIGYIKLSGFTESASSEVKKALVELKEKHNIKSLILDLRGNPGGLLIESVNIVNLFVDKGELIVSTKGKIKSFNRNIYARNTPIDTEIPLFVFVNSGSASASEIVSGAIQDLDRGVIIGQRTFGKGLVQTTRDLSYNTKLKITTAKYYIPSGRCIQALNYSNRNPDGSVGKVPDSLITKFNTRNGRVVLDGGGVMPDIKIKQNQMSNMLIGLVSKYLIFDYVTKYCIEHKSIEPVDKFTFNEYEDFKKYIINRKFTYLSQSEMALEKLINSTKSEKYYDIVKNNIGKLKKQLSHDKEKDFAIFKKEIMKAISHEIVVRYYFQKGRIKYELNNDDLVNETKNMLENMTKYDKILSKNK